MAIIGIQRTDEKWYRSSHLHYQNAGPLYSGSKTRRFDVFNYNHLQIGYVKWYGPWRCYCFFPLDSTIYDSLCLKEIAEFCTLVTQEHKSALYNIPFARNRIKQKRLKRIAELAERKVLTNKEKGDTMVLQIENKKEGE